MIQVPPSASPSGGSPGASIDRGTPSGFPGPRRPDPPGAPRARLAAAAARAAAPGCRRLWLVTTNDNLHALGFYQRRGLRLCTLHAGSLDRDRALKPELPEVNPDNRIPMRDLLELELDLSGPTRDGGMG